MLGNKTREILLEIRVNPVRDFPGLQLPTTNMFENARDFGLGAIDILLKKEKKNATLDNATTNELSSIERTLKLTSYFILNSIDDDIAQLKTLQALVKGDDPKLEKSIGAYLKNYHEENRLSFKHAFKSQDAIEEEKSNAEQELHAKISKYYIQATLKILDFSDDNIKEYIEKNDAVNRAEKALALAEQGIARQIKNNQEYEKTPSGVKDLARKSELTEDLKNAKEKYKEFCASVTPDSERQRYEKSNEQQAKIESGSESVKTVRKSMLFSFSPLRSKSPGTSVSEQSEKPSSPPHNHP